MTYLEERILKIRLLTSIWNGLNDLKTDLSRTILCGLDEASISFTLISDHEDDGSSFAHLTCLACYCHYFILTLKISRGVVVVAGGLEVFTLSQIPSSRPFRLAPISII